MKYVSSLVKAPCAESWAVVSDKSESRDVIWINLAGIYRGNSVTIGVSGLSQLVVGKPQRDAPSLPMVAP